VDSGDTLWAWQSQQSDGSWSIISTALALADASPEAMKAGATMALVLVNRSRDVAVGELYTQLVDIHRRAYGEPVRLARFALEEVEI
jgi:hypothetical protein